MTLLTLAYGSRMEKTWEARRMAEQEGLSFREAAWVVETELFLDEYHQWNIGSPHRLVILHEMFLHATSWGQKEAEHMCCRGHQGSVREPNSEADQSALHLIGYHTSQKELRDVYHSVYLLNRAPGFPSCGEVKRRRAIQEILSSLWDRLQRWTSPAEARDAPGNERESAPPQMYEVALRVAAWKVVETATALQSDLDRLDNELRGRPRAHSQSGSQCRTQSGGQHRMWSRSRCRVRSRSRHWAHSQGQSEDRVGAQNQNHCQVDPQNEQAHSQDHIQEPPNKKVSFQMPGDEDSGTERRDPSAEPPIKDLELWLEYQVDQLGTPTWWGELKAIPGMADLHRFAQKIQVSFYVPEIWSWASPSQAYSAPLAPRSLNQGAFIPERLKYKDVQQRPILLTKAYCRCLQHWAEKSYLPTSLDACPLVESVKELCLAMSEFVTIPKWDILEGLEMERPIDSHRLPSMTLINWVLGPPTEGCETTPATIGIPWQDGMLRLWGRAHLFLPMVPTWPPIHSPGAPTVLTFPPTRVLAVVWPSTLPWGFADIATCMRMPEPTRLGQGTSTDVAAVGRMTQRISSMSTSRIVWDNSTRSIYLDTIAASIGRIVLSRLDTDALLAGPAIREVTEEE